MLFTKLKLNYFGQFKDREIELKPGINLIYGDNEAGKTTIHTFIKGMLFGIERLRGRGAASKEDTYTRYLPWDYPGAYSGSMDIRIDHKDYRLFRSFHANDKYFTVLDIETGREVRLKEGLISELIPGFTESIFKNTISMEQLKAQTDAELATQVRNYIANLSITKSKEVDVAKAVSSLTNLKKQLEATQNMAQITALQTAIEEGQRKEERVDHLTLQLKKLLLEEQRITEQMKSAAGCLDDETVHRMEQLPAMIEKFRSYMEYRKQENILEAQINELRAKIPRWEKEQAASSQRKQEINEMNQLLVSLSQQQKEESELQKEIARLTDTARKYGLICILPMSILALFLAVTTRFHSIGGLILSVIMLAGLILSLFLYGNRRSKKRSLEQRNSILKGIIEETHNKIDYLLQKNEAGSLEELERRQEEAMKHIYALEHIKEQKQEIAKRLSELEDHKDAVYETIMKYMQNFIPEEELTEQTMQKMINVIADKKKEASDRISELGRQQEDCKLNIERVRWELATLEGNEDELIRNKESFDESEQIRKANEIELKAVKLALQSIEELSVDIHDSFGRQMSETVSEVIREVTQQKYTNLKVDEKLDVKVNWNGNYRLLNRLSAGTIDQIYFALRMAVADLLLGKDEMPLLLDDSFALYDEVRTKQALKMLSDRKQVILFSCHKREQVLLKELGISYHLIELQCG